MRIAVASGKGGTGKTTVTVNLALAVDESIDVLDCDVEEPNCAIFLGAEFEEKKPCHIQIPQVDADACNACGKCSKFCEFGAIVCMNTTPLIFPELCHGCGGCKLVCPRGAIEEVPHEIGVIQEGRNAHIRFVQGLLHVGEPMAPPLIRAVKNEASSDRTVIIDAPPGTACPMVATVLDCDYTILVTEPTPFGLNDLTLAVETVRRLGVPFGVVINRADGGDDRVERYCEDEKIHVLLRVPDDRRIAEAYSRGVAMVTAIPEYREKFRQLFQRLEKTPCGKT